MNKTIALKLKNMLEELKATQDKRQRSEKVQQLCAFLEGYVSNVLENDQVS